MRFDIDSELAWIPPKWNQHGIVWTAPRYSIITHATFRPHKTKPDLITLYSARPITPEGRVLEFVVPFVHTAHGVFYRPRQVRPRKPLGTFFGLCRKKKPTPVCKKRKTS